MVIWRNRNALVAGLLAGSCAVAVLADGVGSSAAATRQRSQYAGQTLTVFDGAPSGSTAQQTQDYYNNLSALFHKETGATIKWQYFSSPQQEVTEVETSTVSGSGPDVISYGSSFVGTLVATGDFPFLSNKDWKALGGIKSFVPADLFDSGLTAGKYIGVPYQMNPTVLAYNTQYFRKAGIKQPPTTWTELVQDAKAIQRSNPGVTGVGIDPGDAYDPWKSVFYLAVQLGGNFTAPNGRSATLDSKPVEKATQFYFALEDKFHVATAQQLTWNAADMDSAFLSGKVGMVILGTYALQAAAHGTPAQGKVAFATIPTIPYGMKQLPKGGKPITTQSGGNFWAIPGYVSKSTRALALEFEKLSVSPAMQLTGFKLRGWTPVTRASVAAIDHRDPAFKPFTESAANAIPTFKGPAWSYVETGIETALNNIGQYVARTHHYSQSYTNAQLQQANNAANPYMHQS